MKTKPMTPMQIYDILRDKYNYTEFGSDNAIQGGLRTRKLVELGEEIIKADYLKQEKQ